MNWLFQPTERERWASSAALSHPQTHMGLTTFDSHSRELYERVLPRGVLVPRFMPDRPPVNYWMAPHELLQHTFLPGQIILGKFAGQFLGHLDDRPFVTIAGARAGKTSTILEPNLCLYPGSMLVLDPKGELAKTAPLRRARGHQVHVLDPFGQSGERSASFNALAELDADSPTIVDDVASIAQALITDDGDARAKHWTDSARALVSGLILVTLMLPAEERTLITVRELLCLTNARLLSAVKARARPPEDGTKAEEFFNENSKVVDTLLRSMTRSSQKYGGILAGIGNRFLGMAAAERSGVFSTAAAQTDFLDSLPMREISRYSDFPLASLRADRPTTIYLCLPVGAHAEPLPLAPPDCATGLHRAGATGDLSA